MKRLFFIVLILFSLGCEHNGIKPSKTPVLKPISVSQLSHPQVKSNIVVRKTLKVLDEDGKTVSIPLIQTNNTVKTQVKDLGKGKKEVIKKEEKAGDLFVVVIDDEPLLDFPKKTVIRLPDEPNIKQLPPKKEYGGLILYYSFAGLGLLLGHKVYKKWFKWFK